ncbi:tRNA (N(6)-L-threonylcarbamoyladenosine(37)-C(2))-methylthiotransferase MtaB [Enterocloster lavalensis]|uniref:tRNA (N(6)-L-threonylcarbamoyladenosine(37)-C(2))- methylthiotransferase MtaB n=1 Tax=Enterocloster lavalensis TaxID=460384 RepID=UPI0023F24C1F|nr:tRNA (N(6)-L-threonylcarbamoyladenosine(37)-C(2))-methylthiotransferase MtaB [Enterocloster lavalensis]
MPKAALHNLGCKVNAYETEAMQQQLEARGYEIVPFDQKADVYIINTCSVTNIADRKSRQMLHRAKKMNPDSVVVAAGCYVQVAADALKEDAAVDIIVGNNQKARLADILDEFFSGGREDVSYVVDISHTNEYEALHVDRIADRTRAFIKVQDGCNQFCSYCIIPYARGRVRSRRPEEVLEEVRTLAAQGYKEMVLTGIHLSSYGLDFENPESALTAGDYKAEENALYRPWLLRLIREVSGVEGIERIRLGSLEPRIITGEFAAELARLPKLCPHFHLSLQSGCDATLKRMNRHYNTEEYRERCGILREAFDNPAITTDVIVGFPGETEEEFAATRQYLEQVHFYEMHVFKYSRREGTRAAVMPDQVPEPVKAERSDQLLELEKRMSREYRQGFVGTVQEILLEEPAEIGGLPCMVGHTRQYVRAAVLSADAGNAANCGAPAADAGTAANPAAPAFDAGNTANCTAPALDAGTAANPAAPHEHPAAPARGRIVKARITGFLDEETLLAELTGESG